MSYEFVAAGEGGSGSRQAAKELIEELKNSFNLDDDEIFELVKNLTNIPYKVTVKMLSGRSVQFDVTTTMTLDDFYDQLKSLGPRQMLKLLHNGTHVPYWIPEKEYKPDFMIPANKLPLLDVLDLNLREILNKEIIIHAVLRLGGPFSGSTETDDKYTLCPANAVVFGPHRSAILDNLRDTSKYIAEGIVERLREAYDKYEEDDNIKTCPLTLDVIKTKTKIGNIEFETFPFPHHQVERRSNREAICRCIAFYDFAYLLKWMLRRDKWPLDNTEMSEEDVTYLTNLANHFYEGKTDPRQA